MAVEYVNRKGQTTYFHESRRKTGKPRYHSSMKKEGTLVDAIPEGYEIYEHPNGQVFLRRVRSEAIREDEVATVERAMGRFYGSPYYQLDVKGDTLAVYLPNQDVEGLSDAGLLCRDMAERQMAGRVPGPRTSRKQTKGARNGEVEAGRDRTGVGVSLISGIRGSRVREGPLGSETCRIGQGWLACGQAPDMAIRCEQGKG